MKRDFLFGSPSVKFIIDKSEIKNPLTRLGRIDEFFSRVERKTKISPDIVFPTVTVPPNYVPNYGLLYNWYAATDTRKLTSSDDFVVPLANDFHVLLEYSGAIEINDPNMGHSWNLYDSNVLKFMDIGSFWDSNDGTNTTNLSFRGTGVRSVPGQSGIFFGSGFLTSFLARDLLPSNYTKFMMLYVFGGNKILLSIVGDTEHYNNVTPVFGGQSIRLVRPATLAELLLADGTACTNYVGNDLKQYATVKIGTQVWTTSNLAESKFRNGNYIPGFDNGVYTIFTNSAWDNLTSAGVCVFNNNVNLI